MGFIGILVGAIGAVLVWFITNWVGKPIVDVREKRIKALQVAEQNAHVGYGAILAPTVQCLAHSRHTAVLVMRHSWMPFIPAAEEGNL